MRFLLDTNVWYRAQVARHSIPQSVQKLLAGEHDVFGLSVISVWEVGKKHQRGKLHISGGLLTWLNQATARPVEVLPLTTEIVADAMSLQTFPNRDPADELIVATARVHNLTLLTSDTALRKYPHAKIHYFTPVFLN